MKRRFMAALMAGVMAAGILTGCGKAENSKQSQSAGAEADAEIETIKVYMPLIGGGTTTDVKKVEAAINDYIGPKISTNIELTYINYASWIQQMNLEISSGNQVDLFCTAREIPGYVKNGALLPLDDLLAEYGEGISQYVDKKYLDSCRFSGKLYGVPTLRDMAKEQRFEYSTEIAETYGLNMKEEMTLDELEKEFRKLRTAAPDITSVLFVNSVRPFNSWCGWDPLDNNLGVVFYDNDEAEVVNLFESEYYENLVNRMREWYQEGIIYQDAATADTQFNDFILTGKLLGRFCRWKPGYDEQETAKYGVDLKTVKVLDEQIKQTITDSSQAQFLAWAIPTTSAHPENAMKFLNLLYSDEKLINLMAYGIEGEHYVVSDSEKGFITFPEGVDSKTDTFYTNMSFGIGNQFLGYLWEGNSEHLWSETKEFNDTAKPSPAMGFAFDDTNVVNEVTACNNVMSKYAISLEAGCVDPAVVLPEFQKALKDAGIDKIIEENQRQITEWKKTQS